MQRQGQGARHPGAQEQQGGERGGPQRAEQKVILILQARERKAIEDGRSRRGGDDELDAVFRPKMRQDNMLKAIFKRKEKDVGSRSELVLA